MSKLHTIKEVSELMGISAHTLRFYDNKGLIPDVKRTENNIRVFSEKDMEWVYMIQCLRMTDMPLNEVKHYIDLYMIGDSTVEERYEIIMKQKRKTELAMKQVKEYLRHLEKKEKFYSGVIAGNLDISWEPMKFHSKRDDT